MRSKAHSQLPNDNIKLDTQGHGLKTRKRKMLGADLTIREEKASDKNTCICTVRNYLWHIYIYVYGCIRTHTYIFSVVAASRYGFMVMFNHKCLKICRQGIVFKHCVKSSTYVPSWCVKTHPCNLTTEYHCLSPSNKVNNLN